MATVKRIKTRNEMEIKAWADSMGGVPTLIEQNEVGYHAQPLKIYFNQEDTAETLPRRQVSWETFFQIMQQREFSLVYEENGLDPYYHEFVPEDV